MGPIVVALWAIGVLAFLYVFLGRRVLRVVLFLFGLVAAVALIVTAGVLQRGLVSTGYGGAIEALSRAGKYLLPIAAMTLVVSIAALVVFALWAGRSRFVSMRSLVDGTASASDRFVAIAVSSMMISFFLVFAGIALLLVRQSLLSVVFAVVPGWWLVRAARVAARDYRRARRRRN